MTNKTNLFLVASLCTLLVGCGGSSGSGNSPATNSLSSKLDGSWLSNCYYDDYTDEYSIDLIEFDGNKVRIDADIWDNNTCSGAPVESEFAEGTYYAGDLVMTDSGTNAYPVDFELVYMGLNLTILDLMEIHETKLYMGVDISDSVRPTSIDYSIEYTKQ